MRAAVSVFTRRERDGIDYYRLTPNDIWRALNIQNLNFSGVETYLRLAPARGQTIDFRYTGLRGVHDTLPSVYTKYTFNYPTHSGVAQWQANLPGGFMARTRLGVLDRRRQGPYALWDIYAASSRGWIHPFIHVANITATSYQEVAGVAMPGRMVSGGVELVWRKR